MQTRVLLCKAACLCLLFCACAKEPNAPPDEKRVDGYLSVSDAKKIYAKHCDGQVISVNYFANTPASATKTHSGYSTLHLPLGLTPLWELSTLKTTKNLASLTVPLKSKSAQVAQMIHRHCSEEEDRTPATIDISLIIQSTHDGKQSRLYVETRISDSPTNYKESSYIIISSIQGKYVYAYRWLNGQRSVVTLTPNDAVSGEVRDSTGDGISLLSWDSIGGGEGGGGIIIPPVEVVYCSVCRGNITTGSCRCCTRCHGYPCVCCYRCGQAPCICCPTCNHTSCVCCPTCRQYPCTCFIYHCLLCGARYCNGTCQSGGGGGTEGGITPDYCSTCRRAPCFCPKRKCHRDPCSCVPCIELAANRANPLKRMEILPTVNNNPDEALKNGRFGGRNGTHYGIDLKGEIGDPVYAMYSGTVIYNINKYDPDMPYEEYKEVYGSKQKSNYDAGNRVQIRYDVPPPPPPDQDTIIMNPPPPPEVPEQIYVKYFHLDRTNIIGTGGRVNAGDIIGFLGKTGSASSSTSAAPHLHLEVRVKSNYKSLHLEDPEKYLYTLFRSDGVPYRDCE